MPIPDFGHQRTRIHSSISTFELTCKYVAPGITFSDLMKAYYKAEEDWTEEDQWSGNPTKWQGARGVNAVLDMLLEAVYNPPKRIVDGFSSATTDRPASTPANGKWLHLSLVADENSLNELNEGDLYRHFIEKED